MHAWTMLCYTFLSTSKTKAYANLKKKLDQHLSQQDISIYKGKQKGQLPESVAYVVCSMAACTNGTPDVSLFKSAQGNYLDRF